MVPVDADGGDTRSLSFADKYSNLAELAPIPLHLLIYADIAGIVEVAADGLDEDALEDSEQDVQPFVENLNASITRAREDAEASNIIEPLALLP